MSVALLIVSHSADVARSVADLVRLMAGDDVRVGWTGGNPAGGLGTDITRIRAEIDALATADGIAVLVDLGGAETNSEMAIEGLPPARRAQVVLCNAPLVEGGIMAAAAAAAGGDLVEVRQAAEEAGL